MPKRILLADDSITIQKVVELTFSDGDYEVTAVNNGAKAIAKLGEMRPDVILSDIIMPEKNGYEVCEFVKSHPEYRNIPVVLLTGTFEPFDPDRADKAGCDAVVTKPFESQSLIHKVEELIQQARATAPSAPQPAAPAGSEQLATGIFTPAMEPQFQEHDSDIFGAAAPQAGTPPTDMPFAGEPAAASPWDEPAGTAGETRAYSAMSFDDLQSLGHAPAASAPPPPAPEPQPPMELEPSPWDEQPSAAAPPSGGETRAFPMMSFDELQRIPTAASTPPPPAAPEVDASPWEETPASGETRAYSTMSFDELQKLAGSSEHAPEPPAAAPAAPEPAAPEASPWDEASAAGNETRAFPSMSFDDLQHMSSESTPQAFEPSLQAFEPATQPFEPTPPPPPPAAEPSPWDEQSVDFGSETRSFSRMSFEDLEKLASAAPAAPPAAEPEPVWEPQPAEPAWEPAPEPEPEPAPLAQHEALVEPEISSASPFAAEPEPEPEPATEPQAPQQPVAAAATASGDLTDEQIDRIARRVVQLMSDQLVRNIAWEVIPDMAEMVVKERIRQLEAEP